MITNVTQLPFLQGSSKNLTTKLSRSGHHDDINNKGDVNKLITTVQSLASRSAQLSRPVSIDTDTYLTTLTPEDLLAREEQIQYDNAAQFRIENRLNSLDYNNLTESDFRILVLSASRQISIANMFNGGDWRNIDDMIAFIEEKFAAIENNPNISPERRDIERSIWEDAFIRSLSFYHHNQRTQQSGLFTVADRSTAEANIQTAMSFAFGVIQNVSSLSQNPDIQDLIIRGMEGLIEHEIHMSSQALFKHLLTQRESEDSARSTRNTFTVQMREVVETTRIQMENMVVRFPLFRNIDTRV